MSLNAVASRTDKNGYDELYKSTGVTWAAQANNKDEYIRRYEIQNLTPVAHGGRHMSGTVRGLAVQRLFEAARASDKKPHEVSILDAGSGVGGLSVYLACKGYNVVGVDISIEGCLKAQKLASQLGTSDNCKFLPESLEDISLPNSSIDFVIGLHTLHHFIKYPGVPEEFQRLMKVNAQGFFADQFSENPFYRIFHNKELMERLGDVLLTKKLVARYLNKFEVKLVPTDWFVNLPKLFIKIFGWKVNNLIRPLSTMCSGVDRKIPDSSRLSLFLSNTVMTTIRKT